MHNPAGGSLHRHVHTSNKSSALFRWEVEQPGAAGWPLRRSRTTNSCDTSVVVFYVWDTAFSPGDVSFSICFFHFCACPVINTPTHTRWIQLCSHINFFCIARDFILRGQAETFWHFVFTHIPPFRELWSSVLVRKQLHITLFRHLRVLWSILYMLTGGAWFNHRFAANYIHILDRPTVYIYTSSATNLKRRQLLHVSCEATKIY